jgi:predicted DNA-binding WGR domain protein
MNNNKFYVIQLLEHDKKKNSYMIWTRWGRVGLNGQGKVRSCVEFFGSFADTDVTSSSSSSSSFPQGEPCGDLGAAKALFEKKFREKTKNQWSNRKNFVSYNGKYDLIDVSYSDSDEEEEQQQQQSPKKKGGKLEIDIPDTKLPKNVVKLIELISDQKNMNKALIEMDIDTKKMPLGKLSRKQLKKGYTILSDIEDEISGKNRKARLIDLSNQFYTHIPHSFGMRVPPLITTSKMVSQKTEMLDSMSNMEIAAKLMKKKDGDKIENPIDRTYNEMGIDINPIDRGSELWQTLDKFVTNTHGPTHKNYTLELLDTFTLHDPTAAAKFESYEDDKNRQLLWHGSRMTNFVGILSQGLRIAPPEAPVTGYMFGKGVYFADVCSKSANYCHTSKKDNIGIMMLCEVALGDMYLKRQAEMIKKLPAGKLSCKGEGVYEPDPKDFTKTDTGAVVPYGTCQESGLRHGADTALLYNELIVYDTAQINPKYLLKLKFHYK